MKDKQTVKTQDLASLRDLLQKRDALFPWEAAFALKIKTSEALLLLSKLVKQGKAEQITVESKIKECTGMGCVGCDCTNSYVKKEIKYRKRNYRQVCQLFLLHQFLMVMSRTSATQLLCLVLDMFFSDRRDRIQGRTIQGSTLY